MKKFTLTLICFFSIICSFAQIRDSIIANPDIICNGQHSVLTAKIKGGTPPYSYLWSNSSTDSSIIVHPTLTTSFYSVTVTDHYSASNSATIMINGDSIKIDSIHTIISGTDVEIIPYFSGGTPAFTYFWNTSPPQQLNICIVNSNGRYCVTITDADGCLDSSCVNVNVVSINEYKSNDNFISIFPNPTASNITIESPQNSTIEITNIQGQLIETLATTGNKTNIDVSTLEKGMYFIKVKTERGVAVKKFIKE